MARFKDYNYEQSKLLPVHFDAQILPGTFEHSLCYFVEHEVDLSVFESHYQNDDTGAPAYGPAILLKIILYAYSRGITSSREIAQACRENVVFIALSADSQPHFTTIASFIARLGDSAASLFRDVLLVCDEAGLIGREMFAVDGVKLPSNASKEWSGTRAEFEKKVEKMDNAVRHLVKRHRTRDTNTDDRGDAEQRERQQLATLRAKTAKVKAWLTTHKDKAGKTGKPKKSNITDNDSAKMQTSHGTLQGYTGVAMVDGEHQVIVHAEAFGEGQEHDLLLPLVDGTRSTFNTIGKDTNVFDRTALCADSGYHSDANVKALEESGVDAYIADKLFRKRDPRFATAERHKPSARNVSSEHPLFTVSDFHFAEDLTHCICPAGKRLYRSGAHCRIGGYEAVKFKGPKSTCGPCVLRERCLRYPERTAFRQVAYFKGRDPKAPETATSRMKRKIDTDEGRARYGLRLGIVEPVFGNIRSTLKLDRFTLRGKAKVNAQWLVYCLVHNIGKVHRYGYAFT